MSTIKINIKASLNTTGDLDIQTEISNGVNLEPGTALQSQPLRDAVIAPVPPSSEIAATSDHSGIEILSNKASKLSAPGSTSSPCFCYMNPTKDLLAFQWGWEPRVFNISGRNSGLKGYEILLEPGEEKNRDGTKRSDDVICLGWNCDGRLLAGCTSDGFLRIWNTSGTLYKNLALASYSDGPECYQEIKWNKVDPYTLALLNGKTILVWKFTLTDLIVGSRSGQLLQKIPFLISRQACMEWRSETSFACITDDNCIQVYKLGSNNPTKSFTPHTERVNEIAWDPQGMILASCSVDKTFKTFHLTRPIWFTAEDYSTTVSFPVHSHLEEVTAIKWSPTGPGTANSNSDLMLASASADSTVKLWNVDQGECLKTFEEHTGYVLSVDFSPDGTSLASGGTDKWVYIWFAETGKIAHRYRATGTVLQVCWNRKGDKVGVCVSDGSVVVLDLQ